LKAKRIRDRGENFAINLNHNESQELFMARCGTVDKFRTVKNLTVFDGGFFISRDNGKSFWSNIPNG